MPQRVIFIGNQDAPEFRPVIDWLTQNVNLHCVESVVDGIDAVNGEMDAELILVAPSHRFDFSLDDVRSLQQASPLSQMFFIVGSWCEGETRSGNAWPGIERLYVHQVIPRALSDGWHQTSATATISPCTASNDEHWLSRGIWTETQGQGLVVICGCDAETRATLVDLCRSFGLETVSMKSPRGVEGNPVAVIYDADRDAEQRTDDLERLSTAFPNALIVTLHGYIRHHEAVQAYQAGTGYLIEKPYDIEDVGTCLRQALASRAKHTTPLPLAKGPSTSQLEA